MKPRMSTLNPYATSYIPLSKREALDKHEVLHMTSEDSKSGNETVGFETPEQVAHSTHHSKASLCFIPHLTQKLPISEVSTVKSHPAYDSYGSSSQNQNEMTDKLILDEEFDMDLEYLQMTFPGISDQSLADIYLANKGDLEATVDMLSQLEFYTAESSENLPDSLDIGDISESGSSAECAALKLKNVAVEASASSSGSSDLAPVT